MLDFKARDAERVGQDLEQLVGDLHNTGRAETPGEIDMLKSPSCLVWAVVLFLLCSPRQNDYRSRFVAGWKTTVPAIHRIGRKACSFRPGKAV